MYMIDIDELYCAVAKYCALKHARGNVVKRLVTLESKPYECSHMPNALEQDMRRQNPTSKGQNGIVREGFHGLFRHAST